MNNVDDMDFELPDDDDEDVNQQINMNQLSLNTEKHYYTLYPAYFDGRKSSQQGRRVPIKHAVNTDISTGGIPLTCWHLAEALSVLQLKPVLVEEMKRYSRDYFGFGRVRVPVQAVSDLGIRNKRALMIKVSEHIRMVQEEHVQQLQLQDPAYVVTAETFGYGRNPRAVAGLRYSYGVLPQFIDKQLPKVNNPTTTTTTTSTDQKKITETSATTSSKSTTTKKKKGKR